MRSIRTGCFIIDVIEAYKIPKSQLPYLEPPFAHFHVLLPHGIEPAAHQIVKERLQPQQNARHLDAALDRYATTPLFQIFEVEILLQQQPERAEVERPHPFVGLQITELGGPHLYRDEGQSGASL